jgi:hypothetical protein
LFSLCGSRFIPNNKCQEDFDRQIISGDVAFGRHSGESLMGIRNRLFASVICAATCLATSAALAQESAPQATPVDSGTAGATSAAPAEGRTQEESLVYTDPTMAAPGQSVVGISGEFWYVRAPLGRVINGVSTISPQWTSVYGYGGAVYAGRGDWLVQFEGLVGKGSAGFVVTDPILAPVNAQNSFPWQQYDLSLRYTFSSSSGHRVTPYALLGFNYLHINQTFTLPTASNRVWIASGTPVRAQTLNFETPYAGAGILYQFNDKAGLRFDLDVGPSWGSLTQTNNLSGRPRFTSTGWAFVTHDTLYYKVAPEFVVQAGVKGSIVLLNHPTGGLWNPHMFGAYVSVGYLHHF